MSTTFYVHYMTTSGSTEVWKKCGPLTPAQAKLCREELQEFPNDCWDIEVSETPDNLTGNELDQYLLQARHEDSSL